MNNPLPGTEPRSPQEVSVLSRSADPALVRQRPAELAGRLLPSLGLLPLDLVVAYQLATKVHEQRVKFVKVFNLCQATYSQESVHNARVHCRRLIARLSLVQEAIPSGTADEVLYSLKRSLKKLRELRDVQVQRQALTADLAEHPEVAGLWIELGHREQLLSKSAAGALRQFKLGKVIKRVKALEAELTDPTARLAAKRRLPAVLLRAVEAAYAEAKRRRQALEPPVLSTLHGVRIAYKKFRYMVESLPPAIAEPTPSQLSAMADYQAAMGRVQDVEVLDGFVMNYAERFPVAAADLARFRTVLFERRGMLLQEYLGIADSLYSFWPPEGLALCLERH